MNRFQPTPKWKDDGTLLGLHIKYIVRGQPHETCQAMLGMNRVGRRETLKGIRAALGDAKYAKFLLYRREYNQLFRQGKP